MATQNTPIKPVAISGLYPPDLVRALRDVENWPVSQQLSRIDKLTDEAARRGLARPRHDESMAGAWRSMAAARGL